MDGTRLRRYRSTRHVTKLPAGHVHSSLGANLTGMDDRVGVLGRRLCTADGQVLMTISDGGQVLVDPSLPHHEIARLHGVDRVVVMPEIDSCSAVHLDGPLGGQPGYAINTLGKRVTSFSPTYRPDGPGALYEVVRLAGDDHPAELRFVGYTTD